MGVLRGGLGHHWILKILAKNVFLVSSGKKQSSPLLGPLEKSTSAPLGKNPSDAHASDMTDIVVLVMDTLCEIQTHRS